MDKIEKRVHRIEEEASQEIMENIRSVIDKMNMMINDLNWFKLASEENIRKLSVARDKYLEQHFLNVTCNECHKKWMISKKELDEIAEDTDSFLCEMCKDQTKLCK